MTISFERALGPHVAALQLRSERMNVLANNLANADTPAFQARDFDFATRLAERLGTGDSGSRLLTTAPQHLPGTSTATDNGLLYRIPLLPSADGNTVDAQVEQAQAAENNLAMQASMTFLGSRFKSLVTALRGE